MRCQVINAKQLGWLALCMLWLGAVTACYAMLISYDFGAGEVGSPPVLQSVALPIDHRPGEYLIVMGLHPRCPCTHASLNEMQKIVAHSYQVQQTSVAGSPGIPPHCLILAYQPLHEDPTWSDTAILQIAQNIPYTDVVNDIDGNLAGQFNIHTSGGVVLYDLAGRPLFHGGITGARGHEGDNMGSRALRDHLCGIATNVRTAPAFGCSLSEHRANESPHITPQPELAVD